MSKVVIAVDSQLDAELAWNEMHTARVRHLVVTANRTIAGIVSDRDLGGARGRVMRIGRSVADLMTPRVIVASPEMSVEDAAKLIQTSAIGCLPVVDGKTLVGIVTSSDLLALVARPNARAKQATPRARGPNSRAYTSKGGTTRT